MYSCIGRIEEFFHIFQIINLEDKVEETCFQIFQIDCEPNYNLKELYINN